MPTLINAGKTPHAGHHSRPATLAGTSKSERSCGFAARHGKGGTVTCLTIPHPTIELSNESRAGPRQNRACPIRAR